MKMKRILCLLLALLMLPVLAMPAAAADQVTILFTHDLHSCLQPATDENGVSYGGYARLMTAINRQKELHPDALLVDGGDFSMGSLFQTIYSTDAAELRLLGLMGFDATTFGNHEFDFRPEGFASMLDAAVASGDPLPVVVEANYHPPVLGDEGYGPTAELLWTAYQNYGVEQNYFVVERGGVNFAIFGTNGLD
ncbi:MAG: bifunctional metallophosphatase/5'-nucleotidase, partial [Oscillospiraceae bacterium]|nr:bifunctional metallophosphatase/5'-nucleotidase [Oscillospiraceae bacterium]